jgi:hypothetical protein
MTRFTDWTPAQMDNASLADLLELQTHCDDLKAQLDRHKAIFEMAMSGRFRPNDYGERTHERGEYKVKVKAPKIVKWDDGLSEWHDSIGGIRAKYDMAETAYKALTRNERAFIDKYRTFEPGKVNYRIERND